MTQIKTKIILTILAVVASVFFIGCGGNAPYSPKITGTGPVVVAGTFAISVSPASQSLYTFGENDDVVVKDWKNSKVAKPKEGQSTSATFNITVSPVNGYKGTVQLSASAATASNFLVTSFNPASVTLDGVNPATATFTVTDTLEEAEPGTYTYTVKGTDGSGNTATATTQPTVNAIFPQDL